MLKVEEIFRSFIKEFELVCDQEWAEPQNVYMDNLFFLWMSEENVFEINGTDIRKFNEDLYFHLIYAPDDTLEIMTYVIRGLYHQYFIKDQDDEELKQNMIGLKETFKLIPNLSHFIDKQFIRIQELPQSMSRELAPTCLNIIAMSQNVNRLRQRDYVEIVGIYRANASSVNKVKNLLTSVFQPHLDIVYLERLKRPLINVQRDEIDKTISFTENEVQKFFQMADSKTILEDLVKSFAPSIFGLQIVKKGLLAQLFGGTRKEFDALGRLRFRSEINICLIGDPSTAKSQLLKFVHNISSNSTYINCRREKSNSNFVPHLRKDPFTGQPMIEVSPLIQSDMGICCIDDFERMNKKDKPILLEAMQQQTVSIAKQGIVCQLNSRVSILAAGKPVNGNYNSEKSILENINLDPSLLSRFDLIYILIDQRSEQNDRRLASEILNLYSGKENSTSKQKRPFSHEQLFKYIAYAKQNVHPKLDDRASRKLVKSYTEIRKFGIWDQTVPITTRQLESLIRLSEAFAKMRLSNIVEERDVDEAIRLTEQATLKAAIDPSTGKINIDSLLTGKTFEDIAKIKQIKGIVVDILNANPNLYRIKCKMSKIKLNVENYIGDGEKISDNSMIKVLRMLHNEDVIFLFDGNKNQQFFQLSTEFSPSDDDF